MRIFRHNRNSLAVLGSMFMLLILLSACYSLTATPMAAESVSIQPVKTEICVACDLETLSAGIVQEQNNIDIQAVATAEDLLAKAQETLNSANATLNAVQTQEQNNADAIAAQIEATAKLARANAKATLVAAGSTQSAALTQDVIQQTQVQYNLRVAEDVATQNANAIAMQQQQETQQQAPLAFIWMWCFPIFILLLAGLVLWGTWRWFRMQQVNSMPKLDTGIFKTRYQSQSPSGDKMLRWLYEVKRKLLRNGKKE